MSAGDASAPPRWRPQFSLATLLLAVIASGALMGLYFASRNAEARAKPGPKERALLQERMDIAQKLYEISIQMHNQGVAGVDEVIRAERAMCEAKLALCESKEERIKAFEELLAAETKLENIVDARIKQGVAPTVESLKVRSGRLETEAKLEREKAAR